MASIPFQASIINPQTMSTDVLASNNCTSLLFGDDSNYGQNNEPGHGTANFSNYRTYTLTYYSGSAFYLSSIFNPPTCKPANSFSNSSLNINTGDGWYSLTLVTLPTWNAGSVPYLANTHQVWNPTDGNVYTCITNNTSSALNRPDLTPADWQVILNPTPNIPLITPIFSKYQAQGYFALMCNSSVCLPQMINNALCAQGLNCNNASLCTNDAFINALKVLLLTYSIQTANSLNQIQFTSNQFDLLNSLCGCNTPK